MINGHGDDLYLLGINPNEVINFSSNVCAQTNRGGLLAYLQQHLPLLVASYPEPEPYTLEKALATYYGISAQHVLVSNGATEAIYLLAQLYAGKRSAVLQPTFSEYADAARVHRHNIQSIFSLQDIPQDADMVWLCNPNNPTGKVIDHQSLLEIIDKRSDCLFVVDQSYEYFTQQVVLSVQEAIERPNLLLIHSMTKHYAIPGLRLGYLTANHDLVDRLRNCRMPWSVNTMAISAGEYIVAHQMPATLSVADALAESQRLQHALSQLPGLMVYPSDTHYFLAQCSLFTAAELKQLLIDKYGILIRNADNFEGLSNGHFRVASQTPAMNQKLIQALSEILS